MWRQISGVYQEQIVTLKIIKEQHTVLCAVFLFKIRQSKDFLELNTCKTIL